MVLHFLRLFIVTLTFRAYREYQPLQTVNLNIFGDKSYVRSGL